MNKALLVDLYELTMAQVYFKYKRAVEATFDLFIRSRRRPFYIAGGVGEILDYLSSLRFNKDDLNYLKSLNLFEDEFLEYLKKFKFGGEVWGVEEPEIVFASEPILRISGKLIETQIIESAVLNKINLATTLATKATRVVLAAKERGVYDFSLRRTQGFDAALAAAKYSYLSGAKGTSNVYAGYLYKIPVAGTMAHSFVMSFYREIDSFLSFAKTFPQKSILLVDTYDVKEGVGSAIKVARFLRKKGINILGIRLDSGNLISDAKKARRFLDKEGLRGISIFASGDLDEYKIQELIKARAPIDAFGVGTRMGCSEDAPYCDTIYKLVEIKHNTRDFIPTMKLSEAKTTLPSRKQVFRTRGAEGFMVKDCIGLDKEKISGKKLLKKLMQDGRRLYKESSLTQKRDRFLKKIKHLPRPLRNPQVSCRFPVEVSPRLLALTRKLKSQIKRRTSEKIIFMDIDTQFDFVEEKGALYVRGAEKLKRNFKKLTGFARKHNILIVSSQDSHAKDDPEFNEFGSHCLKGSEGHRKIEGTVLDRYKILSLNKAYSLRELKKIIASYPQVIFEKDVINLFSNPNAYNLLEAIFPDRIYVYGLVTEYCIKEAVEKLIAEEFSVVVVEDAIKEIWPAKKRKLFSLWKKKGVKFTTAAELLKSLSRQFAK